MADPLAQRVNVNVVVVVTDGWPETTSTAKPPLLLDVHLPTPSCAPRRHNIHKPALSLKAPMGCVGEVDLVGLGG